VPRAVLLTLATDREQAEAIAAEAGGRLFVAMDNCPHQTVLVGERDAAERARAIAIRGGVIHGELPYDRAVHTPLFGKFSEDRRDVFAEIGIGEATTQVYSCTTAAPYPGGADRIRELFVEHWSHPVEFHRTIENLYADGARVFVECGPRGNMTGFIDDILRGRPYCTVPADLPRRPGTSQLNHLVAMVAAHDVQLDATYLYEHRRARLVDWETPHGDEADTARGQEVSLSVSWPMKPLSRDAVDRVLAPLPARNGADHLPPARPPLQPTPPEHAAAVAGHAVEAP